MTSRKLLDVFFSTPLDVFFSGPEKLPFELVTENMSDLQRKNHFSIEQNPSPGNSAGDLFGIKFLGDPNVPNPAEEPRI